ncbi:MAG: hypothetical protein FJ271_24140 [Planctomycetes bacterium]|nr:hypothetical protein [Planctomycetota bacterium]
MATRRYGISKGETEFQITEAVGSATAADNVEVTVDFDAPAGKTVTKAEVLQALGMIENHILKSNWPPA